VRACLKYIAHGASVLSRCTTVHRVFSEPLADTDGDGLVGLVGVATVYLSASLSCSNIVLLLSTRPPRFSNPPLDSI